MYVLQDNPESVIRLEHGSWVTPVATLKDEHGGVSHIIIDDHCYVLVQGLGKSEGHVEVFRMVKHWYQEAVDALNLCPKL